MTESYPIEVLGWRVKPSDDGLSDTLEVNISIEGEERVALVPIVGLPISCATELDAIDSEELLRMLQPNFDQFLREKKK